MSTTRSNKWLYRQPVEIRFGSGSISQLAEAVWSVGGTKGLVITSPSLRHLAEELQQNPDNRIAAVYSEVRPNPSLQFVDECAALLRAQNLDFVVAMGGGSVLDCAKAAAAIAEGKHTIRYYYGTEHSLPQEGLPVIAVPTTAGTGSEVTSVSVLSDKHNKLPLNAPSLTARIAIIDPLLTMTLPPKLTAISGIDALCHAIEGYSSIQHQPICDALAVHAARLVLENLETAVADGKNQAAREAMAEAAVIAGLAFALPKTTGPHACSYPLTAQYGIPHGEACGLTLEWFVKINAGIPRIQELARQLGFTDAAELSNRITELKQNVRIRTNLRDFKLTATQIEKLVQDSQHPNLRNNPVPVTIEMIKEMYRSLAE